MKFIYFLLGAGCLYSFQTNAQIKRALIVAIGNYPTSSGWEEISSINDYPLIEKALVKQQFEEKNIAILADSAATKTGIEAALNKLIVQSGRGDIVVIHFSSHGEQIEDDNGDEVDGLDECIVPYGAILSENRNEFKKFAPGYFRDDEFGSMITLLRNKLGKEGDVLVSIDACHSGTGTRGVGAKIRGSKPAMVSNDFENRKQNAHDTAGVFKDNNNTILNKDAATYVVISASQAQEKNSECYDDDKNPVGSLSYALSKALVSLEGKISYRSLFSQIEDVMRSIVPQQRPVLEGDGIDRELFGGKYVDQKPYVTINMDLSDSTIVVLNAGAISGITTGSSINFYPGGTTDPSASTPIQKGSVIAAGNFSSTVKLDKKDPALLKKVPWAFVVETSYGKNKIKLNVKYLKNGEDQKLREGLKDFPLIEINPLCDLYIDHSGPGPGWGLFYPDSDSAFAYGPDLNNLKDIKDALKRFARFRYLKDLKFSEQGLAANVEFVFLDQKEELDNAKMLTRKRFGRLELKEGDSVYLKITNAGDKDFFINIVDIQPDGKINPIMPNKKLENPITLDSCKVKAKSTVIKKKYSIKIAPPYGEETFKVFLSASELDLEDILTGNDDSHSQSRGVLNNLAKIFKDSEVNEMGTRGGQGKINTAQNGTISSLNFRIIP